VLLGPLDGRVTERGDTNAAGKRPSTAACTRVGARNASEIVILTRRGMQSLPAAICPTSAHVPFKGTAPALNALIGSHVDMIFMELAAAIKLHQGGKARILAVATLKRIPSLPDIPTLDEAGVKGFESGTWNAIAAPPKTPAAIVAKLNKAINEVLMSPDVQDKFKKLNLHAAGGTPAEAKVFITKETKVWSDVIKAAHVVIKAAHVPVH